MKFFQIKKLNYLNFITFFLFILGCGGTNRNVDVDAGNFLLNKLALLKENVRTNPESPEVHLQLAKVYFELDSLNLALESVDSSLAKNPDYAEAKLLRANSLLNLNRTKAAYTEYLEILQGATSDELIAEIRTQFGQPFAIYQLTNDDFNNAFPYFSPDDNNIVFQSDRDGNWEIYMMDADGTRIVRLTKDPAQDEMPVFSTDQNIIAFTSTRDDSAKGSRLQNNRNIYLMKLENGEVINQINHLADDWYPSLAERSQQLVFVSERDDVRDVPFQDRLSELYLEDSSNSLLLRLTQNEADDGSPSFSSDGKRITFTSNRSGSFQIFAMDNKGANVQQLTKLKGDCGSPHFSHDGSKIAFFANRFGNYDIFWMNETGNNVERLTNYPAQDGYPVFSSDRRKIVFHSDRSGKFQIYWIDLMSPLNYDQLTEALGQAIDSLK